MAARAFDVAAMSLKGASANLNFPEFALSLPRPVSPSPCDIQIAAAAAGASVLPCAEYHLRASWEEQESGIEMEELQKGKGDCFGKGDSNASEGFPSYEAEERGQCEQGNEGGCSPVPGMFPVCEEGQRFYHGFACTGVDLFDDEMRYVFAEMAEAMLIAPPSHFPVSGGIDGEEEDNKVNWDFWLWDLESN